MLEATLIRRVYAEVEADPLVTVLSPTKEFCFQLMSLHRPDQVVAAVIRHIWPLCCPAMAKRSLAGTRTGSMKMVKKIEE